MTTILNMAMMGTGNRSTRRIYPYLSRTEMKVNAMAARHLGHAEEGCA